MNNIVKDYRKLGKRNKKKDDEHLNKHAMHLVSPLPDLLRSIGKG